MQKVSFISKKKEKRKNKTYPEILHFPSLLDIF